MAYFIFLKYLDSLEDFRKNPKVKIPPKSLLYNFSKFCQILKSIKIQKEFLFEIWPRSGFGPAAAHLSYHPGQPTTLFPSHWASAFGRPSQSALPSITDTRAPPRSSSSLGRTADSTTAASRALVHAASRLLPSTPKTARAPPLITPHHHPCRSPPETAASTTIMAHHQRRPFPSVTWPQRSPSNPINECPNIPSSHCSSPVLFAPILSPERPRTGALPATAFTAVARLPHCRPTFDEAQNRSTAFPLHLPPLGQHPCAPEWLEAKLR
jgi:hypothetical protein